MRSCKEVPFTGHAQIMMAQIGEILAILVLRGTTIRKVDYFCWLSDRARKGNRLKFFEKDETDIVS